MHKPRIYSWADPQAAEGLLFFAQRLEECLHDYTLDTYKAPALNTHTRCIELLRTVEDVRSGAIMPKTLQPIIEELCDSIRNDAACRALIEDASPQLLDEKWWAVTDPMRLGIQAQLLRGFLWKRSYERELRAQLLVLVSAKKEKAGIQALTVNLAVEWMRMRFSRDYIYYRTRTFFFGFRKVSADATKELQEFFSFFEPGSRNFDVCFRATASLAALQPILPAEVAIISAAPPAPRTKAKKEATFLERQHSGVFIVVPEVEAADARSAREEAVRRLENISTLAYYHIHRTPLEWEGDALVWDDSRTVVLKASRLPVHKEDECAVGELPSRVRSTISALNPSSLPRESWIRFRAALGLHASAIGSQDVSVQLTTLWSAVETLIPATADEARITQVTDVLVPILASRYPRKLFNDLDKSLRKCAGKSYHEALAGLPPSDRPDWLRCGELVAIRANEQLRDKVYPALSRNPLLRYRIFALLKTFGDAKAALAAIDRHKQRIAWHVRRIYRCRNLLVHAGHTLPYREAVVENLHSYFHSLINALEFAFADPSPPPNLDAAFMRERLLFEQHQSLLRDMKGAQTSVDNLIQVLAGPGRYVRS